MRARQMSTQVSLKEKLEQWRRTFDPSLADEIDALSAAAMKELAPPKPTTAKNADSPRFHELWMTTAKARDPVALAWLLSTLTSRLEHSKCRKQCYPGLTKGEEHYHGIWVQIGERVDRLKEFAPDPRIAQALAEVVAAAQLGKANQAADIYGPMLKLLGECNDVRQIEVLERGLSSPRAKTAGLRTYLAESVPPVIDKLRASGRTTSPAPRKKVPGDAPSAARLLEAVHADVDADEPRLVYADWLLEQGDPRGELIVLQTNKSAAPSSAEQERRLRALLSKENVDRWCEGLRPLLTTPIFTRGFLTAAELAKSWQADEATWKRAQKNPVLATVEELHQGSASAALYEGFLRSPVLRSLRVAEARVRSTLDILSARDTPLRHLELPLPLYVKCAKRVTVFDGLKSLGLHTLGRERRAAEIVGLLPQRLEGLSLRESQPVHDLDELWADAMELWDARTLDWVSIQTSYPLNVRATLRRSAKQKQLELVWRIDELARSRKQSIGLERLGRSVHELLTTTTGISTVTLTLATQLTADELATIERLWKGARLTVVVRPASEIAAVLLRY